MTEQSQAFQLEKTDQGIAVVTIDIPGESVNTLKVTFADEVNALLANVEADSSIKGLVFISGKPSSFIAGADIHMIDACQNAEEVQALAEQGQQVFARIEAFRIPVVAAIHGVALGGGLELALACHYRITSDDEATKLGLPEVQLGLLPGSGGTQRLPRLVGIQKALDMILTGRQIRPNQALKMGLVDDVVPSTVLREAAIKLALQPKRRPRKTSLVDKVLEGPLKNIVFNKASEQAQKKAHHNYPAIDRIIDTIQTGVEEGTKAGYALEAKNFGFLAMTPVSKHLRQLFFMTTEMKGEKTVAGAEPKTLEHIGVLGGGLMGGGIAHVTVSKAKLPVRLKDINQDGIQRSLRYHDGLLKKRRKRRHLSEAEYRKQLHQVTGTTDYTGFKQVDFVVEAVFESLELKQRMVLDIEKHTRPDTIFATNTSSLPIGQIAAKAVRPENVIGLHYFSPVEKMPLVEVIAHESTSNETIATTMAFAKKQGKTPILVQDKAGFYVNRILAPYMNAAAKLILAGEPIDKVDKAFVQFGFPVGPITLLDEVGIDIAAKVADVLKAELGERFQAPDIFKKLLDDGRLGRKTKKGFYKYGKQYNKKKEVDPQVYTLLGVQPTGSLSTDELIQTCLIPMLHEAALCLEEGVIQSARDGDVGAVFGIGFPPFLGGPFHYMDSLGVQSVLDAYVKQQGNQDKEETSALLQHMAKEGLKFF